RDWSSDVCSSDLDCHGPVRDVSPDCAAVLPQRHHCGRPLPRGALGQPALYEAVAAVWPARPQEPRLHQLDAASPLDAQCGAEGELASLPGPRARVAGAVLCQAAIERVFSDEVFEEKAGRKDDAAVPAIDRTV